MELERSIVQCSQGAYSETVWVPFVSFTAIRLGRRRLQRCPVHGRWELVRLLDEDEWTPEILAEAARHQDSGIV